MTDCWLKSPLARWYFCCQLMEESRLSIVVRGVEDFGSDEQGLADLRAKSTRRSSEAMFSRRFQLEKKDITQLLQKINGKKTTDLSPLQNISYRIVIIVMRALGFICRAFGNVKVVTPSFYNPNISLISNIGRSRELSELLSLHQSLGQDFTTKHLAQAARRLCQIIKEHKSHLKNANGLLLDRQHQQQLKAFLKDCSQTEMGTVTAEQFINFAVFAQKIVKFQGVFPSSSQDIAGVEYRLRLKLLEHFDSRLNLQECNFQQLCSIYNSTSPIMNDQQCTRLLACLRDLLLTKPYCTCFHLSILAQMLNERPSPSPSFSALAEEIQELSEKEALSQFEEIKEYLCPRFIIQIFNGFFNVDKVAWTERIPLIVKQIHKFEKDKTMFSRFFEKDLNYLEKILLGMGSENRPAVELLQIIRTGRKEHSLKHSSSPNVKQKSASPGPVKSTFFSKRKTA